MSSTSSNQASGSAAPAPSWFSKLWGFVKKLGSEIKLGIEEVFGTSAGQAILAAAESLLASEFGPVALTAVTEAVDVTKGELDVNQAVKNVLTAASAAGKSLTQAAALQVVSLLQNELSSILGKAITPVTTASAS